MSESRVLKRLHRLRVLQEETSRMVVELAVAERNRIYAELTATEESEYTRRRELHRESGNPDAMTRMATLVEMQVLNRRKAGIEPRLHTAEARLSQLREEFLARRVESRQVEALLEQEEKQARELTARHVQQDLDDWYSRKILRASVSATGQKTDSYLDRNGSKSVRASREK